MKENNPFDLTFTIFLCFFMIVTYPFLKTDNFESGCTDNISTTLVNKFYHDSISHLFIDVITLLFLYELEKSMGSTGIIVVFLTSLLLVSIFETTLVNIYPNVTCSSGLFGVFVAMGTFDVLKSVPNKYIIVGLVIITAIIVNMINNNIFHYMSDYIGFFVGLLLALTC